MIEFNLNVMSRGSSNCGIILPLDTGPGPQTLIGCYNEGSDQRGFFGEVKVEDFITGDKLSSALGITAGTGQNSDDPWLKFYIDGKIYFVSKKTIRSAISWNNLNSANVVNGNRTIAIKGNTYRVGMLRGLGPNTSGFVNREYDNASTHGSEWNRLMYNVSKDHTQEIFKKHSQVGENWFHYSDTDLFGGNGSQCWCPEISPENTLQRVRRGPQVSYMYAYSAGYNDFNVGWRPRLELVG